MKIKLNDVISARPALERLFSCSPKKAKDTFRLARIQREVQPIVADYETARVALLEKYASRDPELRTTDSSPAEAGLSVLVDTS